MQKKAFIASLEHITVDHMASQVEISNYDLILRCAQYWLMIRETAVGCVVMIGETAVGCVVASHLSLSIPLHSYLGGLRLLQATCKKFYQYCAEHG